MHYLQRFARDIRNFVRNGHWSRTDDGGILIRDGLMLMGTYIEGVKGQPDSFRVHRNLIPDEGVLKILGLAFYTDAKINTWYLAPFSGSTTPAANLTANNFASTQSEITSLVEGFSEVTRPQWVPAQPAAGKVTNVASKAEFSIVCATTLNINGAGLLSSSARGGTSGILASASKYAVTRQVANSDTWECGYEVSLTDS